jgi:hypothetical protein
MENFWVRSGKGPTVEITAPSAFEAASSFNTEHPGEEEIWVDRADELTRPGAGWVTPARIFRRDDF